MFRLELAIIRLNKLLQETAAFFILISLWSLLLICCFVYGVTTSLRRVVLHKLENWKATLIQILRK
jgi:hypothetical protein